MANPTAAFGLLPLDNTNVGGRSRITEMTIASSYATALGAGDPVERTGTGDNIKESVATNTNSCGVFLGCRYTDPSTGEYIISEYYPGSIAASDIKALVQTDPTVVMRIRTDTLAEADCGLRADWDTGTPSATTKRSGVQLNVAAAATDDGSLRILRLAPIEDNAYGTDAVAEVQWVEHEQINGVGV